MYELVYVQDDKIDFNSPVHFMISVTISSFISFITFSIFSRFEFKNIICIYFFRFNTIMMSIHPGTTDTDLSVPFQKNVKTEKLFSAEKSCGMMLNVIWGADLEQTGKFVDFAGIEILW